MTKKTGDLKYKCVLYDFDGTLADSVPVIILNQRMAYEEVMGYCPRTDEDLKSYIGLPLTDTFAMHDEVTQKKLLESYQKINLDMLRKDMIRFSGPWWASSTTSNRSLVIRVMIFPVS